MHPEISNVADCKKINMKENKPILVCTLEEVVDTFGEKLAAILSGDTEPITKKNLVYGLAGLAKLLGCSISTAARIKKSGVLTGAIHQTGKVIVVDADLALDLMKIKKGRKWN